MTGNPRAFEGIGLTAEVAEAAQGKPPAFSAILVCLAVNAAFSEALRYEY